MIPTIGRWPEVDCKLLPRLAAGKSWSCAKIKRRLDIKNSVIDWSTYDPYPNAITISGNTITQEEIDRE